MVPYSAEDYKLFQLAIDAIEMTTIVDADGRIRYIGKKYAAIVGVTQEEAFGRLVSDLIPDTQMLQVLKSGKAERGRVFIMKNRVPIIVDRYPIRDAAGQIRGAICVNSFSDVTSIHKLSQTIKELEQENQLYRHQLDALTNQTFSMDSIIGTSAIMRQLKTTIQKVAVSDLPVLITGKTGTGKEVIADAIHHLSNRKYGKFIKINCAAIPKELLESELFGYSEGAFSGAAKGGKPGKFELADGGTLLLDEIGEMPMQLQSKLLRVLQEHVVERVGGLKPIPFNARVVCSTNRDLIQMVADGLFRQDLYYRINVVELHVPPLRKRKEDIPELCSALITKINRNYGCNTSGISPDVLELFDQYDWPGNVRELEHVLERACVLSPTGILEMEDFEFFLDRLSWGSEVQRTGSSPTTFALESAGLRSTKDRAEQDAILNVLTQTKGNKSRAAKLLGITRSALYQKLQKYGIDSVQAGISRQE